MSLLLLFAGGGTFTPIDTDKVLAILTPDEVATGVSVRLWVQYVENTAIGPVTNGPQLAVWKIEDDGTRTAELALSPMAALGDSYYEDWTPSEPGTFLITAAAEDGATVLFVTEPVSARPKFDPIALALHETLVSRM